ncbi:hypothetical protein E1A91_D07G127400v1 [Gossypium mustelinum]|uniref:Uncharacterized protein n=3 Tax=Gossypium TaxID=3633 RepID=A0A5J5QSG5_GOSBA|nr:hypothetical protein ES319_D07G123600v1 [Gossypium barbadense]TYH62577.1 hypothetical protein ES332_D07G129600v1 [Gossypium tomentosum]TYI73403.1 hypothetical protein E1A91_D07G127400v1 [Gossypium mustelinum]
MVNKDLHGSNKEAFISFPFVVSHLLHLFLYFFFSLFPEKPPFPLPQLIPNSSVLNPSTPIPPICNRRFLMRLLRWVMGLRPKCGI